jgi:hypothetical protein
MAALIDHDALFKLLLTSFFREFLELVARSLPCAQPRAAGLSR